MNFWELNIYDDFSSLIQRVYNNNLSQYHLPDQYDPVQWESVDGFAIKENLDKINLPKFSFSHPFLNDAR